MSKYTTELRFICENLSGLRESEGYDSIDKTIQNSWNKIFNNFPIFDENYRESLCTKIIMHYYTREICEETVGLWKLRLATRMNEIMPFYNQLYLSTQEKFDIFEDVNVITQHTNTKKETASDNDSGTDNIKFSQTDSATHHQTDADNSTSKTDGTNTTTATTTGKETNAYSDTPQGALTNIETMNYLTNGRIIDNNDTSNGSDKFTQNITNTDSKTTDSTDTKTIENNTSKTTGNKRDRKMDHTDKLYESVKGKTAGKTYSEMLLEYRETFLNIDAQVIAELDNLFMLIW